MSLQTIVREFQLHAERLRAEGVPDAVFIPILMRAEVEVVKAQLEHDRARVAVIRACGTGAYAERAGVTPRTVRNIVTEALQEIGNKMTYLASAQSG